MFSTNILKILRNIDCRYHDWNSQRKELRRVMLMTCTLSELKTISHNIGFRIALARKRNK